ncbi:DUF6912 family protein [Rhodococcus pyridinivorans]|uniref:DUF6912 family protein n=1 Tax=Rhodococcus pyridinivorans TaxID=103816 RepID=UPI0039B4401E
MTRVYVPATLTMLQGLVADGEFDAVGRTAFAVTPALRESYTAGDDEELAEVAMAEAARASLRLLGSEEPNDHPSFASRRVVIAADVDEVKPRPDLDDAVVKLTEPITMRAVASVHIDLQEAEADVARAREIVDAAELGDEEAEFVLGDAEDHELAWYATQELPFLLELL